MKKPIGVIIGAFLAGILLAAFLVYSTWYSAQQIRNARMRGTIVAKKFIPAPSEEITIGKGGLQAENKKGNFTITVSVRQKDGSMKDYLVENLDEKRWNNLKIGDHFDVGPYLSPP